MNKIRVIIGTYFKVPVNNLSYPEYFNYLNESGKITARSLMDLVIVLATFIEEQETKNEQYDLNFKDIQEVLGKLVDKKLETPTTASGFICDVCGKQLSTKLALAGHKRSHK